MMRMPVFAAPFGQDNLLRFFAPLENGFGPDHQPTLPLVALEDLLAGLPVDPLPRDHMLQLVMNAGRLVEKAETMTGTVALIEINAAMATVSLHLEDDEAEEVNERLNRLCLAAVTQWGLGLETDQRRALWAACNTALGRGGRAA